MDNGLSPFEMKDKKPALVKLTKSGGYQRLLRGIPFTGA
jgi:uncharacterized protein YjiK